MDFSEIPQIFMKNPVTWPYKVGANVHGGLMGMLYRLDYTKGIKNSNM